MRQMEVIGVRVEMPSNSPIVLLKEAQGDRYLPIWIGAVEATAIAFAQQGMVSLRRRCTLASSSSRLREPRVRPDPAPLRTRPTPQPGG